MSGTRHQITMWSPLIHHVFTNLCVQEALFPAFLQQFFFPFFYNFLPKPGLLTDFRSSLSQIRNQTEGLESECWGSEVSAPTHLKGPNKVPYRNLFTSHSPLFTFTRHSVMPAANHSSDPQHMCSGIWILIGHLCFQFPGALVQQYWVVLRNLEGKGIPNLWLEYCLGSPKQTISQPGVN